MPLKATVKYLNNKPQTLKEMGKFVTRAVTRSAFLMEAEIKLSATNSFTQRTGHLRRSVRAKTKGEEFGKAEVGINPVREGADVNYAIHLEYGTKYIAPRAFIRKGVGKTKKKMPKIFAEEAKKAKDKIVGVPKKV